MPFTISWEPGVAVKAFTGHVTGAEVRKALVQLQSHAGCDTLQFSVNDFTQVESFEVSESDLVDFAALSIGARAFNSRVRVLVVSARQEVLHLVDIYKQMGNGQVLTMATMEHARAWMASQR